MKLTISLISAIIFLGINQFLIAEPLTLDDCLRIAKEQNLELRQARLSIDNARAGLTEANASYYPNIGFSTSYRTGGDFADRDISGNYSSGLNASYPLYRGGSIRAGSKIANLRIKIAEENYRQKEAEVVLAVKQAFYKILQIQEQIALIENILKRRRENLALIKLNYSVGRENQPNVAQAEASLSQTEYEYFKAKQNLSLAKQELNLLLNQPHADIEIIHQNQDIHFPTLDTLMQLAQSQRPDIISENYTKKTLEAQLIQARSNYLPTLSLSSSYNLSGQEFLEQSASWSAGVNLSLPIFNGFSTLAKVRQAKIALQQAELKINSLQNNILAEVSQAYTNWQLAKKNLEVSQKTLQAVRAAYQLTKLQYEQGRTSYYFVQQKESELTQAENANVNALYNLYTASAVLEKVIGRSN